MSSNAQLGLLRRFTPRDGIVSHCERSEANILDPHLGGDYTGSFMRSLLGVNHTAFTLEYCDNSRISEPHHVRHKNIITRFRPRIIQSH